MPVAIKLNLTNVMSMVNTGLTAPQWVVGFTSLLMSIAPSACYRVFLRPNFMMGVRGELRLAGFNSDAPSGLVTCAQPSPAFTSSCDGFLTKGATS